VHQLSLLREPDGDLPPGLRYVPELLSEEEERALIGSLETLAYNEIRMHGVVAKRSVVHHGWEYGYDAWSLRESEPIPPFLHEVRDRAARLVNVAPSALAEALSSRYPPGAGIGWHRDAPMFGLVVGISLNAPCVMRFRPWENERESDERRSEERPPTKKLVLEPRSAYVLDGEARSRWQHTISPVKELRYSISFRTLRRGVTSGSKRPSRPAK
jgi:DNA oxidative demethylase